MYRCFTINLALFLALESVAFSSRIQYSVPKEDLAYSSRDPDSPSQVLDSGDLDLNDLNAIESSQRLRTALRALLKLNDGELSAILKGVPIEDVEERVSPSTAFFLEATKSRFERIKSLISDGTSRNPSLPGDLLVAKRRKKSDRRAIQSAATLEESEFESSSGDPDSLLLALTQLSESLKKNHRKGKRKHKRHSYHSSSSARKIHYSYWLKPEECTNSREGFPRVHCPSPSESGEWVCVEDRDLCDGLTHCPGHEDEEPLACLFFKSMQNYVDLIVSALLVSRRS